MVELKKDTFFFIKYQLNIIISCINPLIIFNKKISSSFHRNYIMLMKGLKFLNLQ